MTASVSYRRPVQPKESNAIRMSNNKPICWSCGKVGHQSYRYRGSAKIPRQYVSRKASPEKQPLYKESSSNREKRGIQSSQSSKGTPSPNRERQE